MNALKIRPLEQVLRRLLMARLLLPLSAALLGLGLVSAALIWNATARQQDDLARVLALSVDDRLQRAAAQLTAAARAAAPGGAEERLRLPVETAPDFRAVYLLDASGVVVLALPPDAPAPPAGLSGESGLLSAALPARPAAYLVAPLAGGGALAGEISLPAVQQLIERGVSDNNPNTAIRVLSPNGEALAASAQKGLSGSWGPGLHFARSAPGLLVRTSQAAVGETGWTVSVDTAIFTALRGYAVGGLLLLILVIGLAVALVLNYGRRLRHSVAAPLEILNQRVSQMTHGDYNGEITFSLVISSFSEVAELAGNFQRMQQAVRERQTALKANEKRFRAMAELLPDMTFEMDVRRRITFANRTAAQLLGYSAADFEAGMQLDQLVHAADAAVLERGLYDLAAGNTSRLLTVRFLRRDRQTLPAELSISPIRDEQSRLAGFRCAARDISERLKSEEVLRRSYQLFTAGPVVVFRVNAETQRYVEYVSPNVAQFGYVSADFLDAPDFFDTIIHPNDLPHVQAEAEAHVRAGEDHYGQEYRLRCADGSYRWVYAFTSVARGGDGRPAHIDWYILEISERKRNEERIQVQLERLGALQTIGAFIENNADIHFTLQTILTQIIEMLRVDGAALLRYERQSAHLSYLVHDGFYLADPAAYRFAAGESYPGIVALGRKAVPINAECDTLAAEFKFPEMKRERFTAYYGLPLMVKGEVQGVLEIFNRAPLPADLEWRDFLDTLAGQAAIAIHNADLLEDLSLSKERIERAYNDTITALARAIDAHDEQTEEHSRRLRDLTEKMARRAGMGPEEIKFARIGALLHDIGKIGIPTELIKKQGRLTEDDRQLLDSHTLLAENILGAVEYLRPAMDIPRYHHEKYDGSGYPYHRKGEEIPLVARIFAVADVWDALTNARPYRSGADRVWPKERALAYLREQKGKYFDPAIVDMFIEMVGEGGMGEE